MLDVQTNLDVISVNIWQILISLANLFLLFLIVKKFLYQPAKNILAKRQEELEVRYKAAEEAEAQAKAHQAKWEETVEGAQDRADEIILKATEQAKRRGEAIVTEAKTEAAGMIRQAEQVILQEQQKARDDVKREIVEVSGMLSEKMLEREIKLDDHRALIDAFIDEIGDKDE